MDSIKELSAGDHQDCHDCDFYEHDIFVKLIMTKHLPRNDTVDYCSSISDHKQPPATEDVDDC